MGRSEQESSQLVKEKMKAMMEITSAMELQDVNSARLLPSQIM